MVSKILKTALKTFLFTFIINKLTKINSKRFSSYFYFLIEILMIKFVRE